MIHPTRSHLVECSHTVGWPIPLHPYAGIGGRTGATRSKSFLLPMLDGVCMAPDAHYP